MEFQSRDNINNKQHLAQKRSRRLPTNDTTANDRMLLIGETKKLFGEAISKYLKNMYTKSGIQGNPKKADVLNKINSILDNLPLEIKEFLSEYGDYLKPAARKQFIEKFVTSLLKDAFKNRNFYSKNNSEVLNKQVKTIIKKLFSDVEHLGKFALQNPDENLKQHDDKQKILSFSKQNKTTPTSNDSEAENVKVVKLKPDNDNQKTLDQTQQKNTGKSSKSSATARIAPPVSEKDRLQQVAEDKLAEINGKIAVFSAAYKEFADKLRLTGAFLNLGKAYSALSASAKENGMYSDTPVLMQDQSKEQQTKIADYILKVLNHPQSDDYKNIITYLTNTNELTATDIANIKNYFFNKSGEFPADSKSLLNLLLNPKQEDLYTGNKTASEVLHFRHLVLKGFTNIQHTIANAMFTATSQGSAGTLITTLNDINKDIKTYNDFLEDNPSVISPRVETNLTFNDATGGFVMFSTFTEEYRIAEADRQAAAIQGEGYHKTISFLQSIQAGLTRSISSQAEGNTSAYTYLQHLTTEQIAYLGSRRLVETGKSVKEKYFPYGAQNSTPITRGDIQAIASELGAIIKAYEDKSQKVNVTLQDATEKRNIAASTLSKFLDKIYDVYKLTAQF